jgi:hypothetical protein
MELVSRACGKQNLVMEGRDGGDRSSGRQQRRKPSTVGQDTSAVAAAGARLSSEAVFIRSQTNQASGMIAERGLSTIPW